MQCYDCNGPLDAQFDAKNVQYCCPLTSKCSACSKRLYDNIRLPLRHYSLVYPCSVRNKARHVEQVCPDCYCPDDAVWSRPCYLCGGQHPDGADSRLSIWVQGGYRVVVYTACSDDHYRLLLDTMLQERIGWCPACDLHHTTADEHRTRLQSVRYVRIDPKRWFSLRSWSTWWHMRWYGAQGGYEVVREELLPTGSRHD